MCLVAKLSLSPTLNTSNFSFPLDLTFLTCGSCLCHSQGNELEPLTQHHTLDQLFPLDQIHAQLLLRLMSCLIQYWDQVSLAMLLDQQLQLHHWGAPQVCLLLKIEHEEEDCWPAGPLPNQWRLRASNPPFERQKRRGNGRTNEREGTKCTSKGVKREQWTASSGLFLAWSTTLSYSRAVHEWVRGKASILALNSRIELRYENTHVRVGGITEKSIPDTCLRPEPKGRACRVSQWLKALVRANLAVMFFKPTESQGRDEGKKFLYFWEIPLSRFLSNQV